ncbi:MAG: recombinase family protein [Oscillospiraceae bacterium]|jgi:DNA invertase Pin-like site-specific DNA recombinase|nr:recombinase family protein [Oscillospiraceae bacterium]
MKTAAAYIRVSTNDQMEYSPDSQLACIRDYASKNGYLLLDEYIFREDDGISGRGAAKRTEFQRMISQAKRQPRPFDCLLLWKFSRFARSRADSVLYKTILRHLGIEVVSVSEPLGEDKTSILVEAMIEAMDEYYSVNLAEEVRRGMREKILRGEPVTAPPFGYRIEKKHFVPEPDEAGAVRLMYTDFLQGSTAREIAEKLNAAGFQTRRGGGWEARAVCYILKNPAYRGVLRWNPGGPLGRGPAETDTLLKPNCHEAIVSAELWDAVQSRMQTGATHRRAPPCALRGLVYCSDCGSLLVPSSSGSMQCCGYTHGKCSVSHCISIQKLESMVIALLENDLQATALNISFSDQAEKEEEPFLLRHQLNREHARLKRLREAYLNGAEPLADYTREHQTIEQVCRTLESRLSKIKSRAAPVEFKKDVILLLRGADVSAEQKNALLHALIQRIVFDRRQNLIRLYYR